jgi:hypothetical protein
MKLITYKMKKTINIFLEEAPMWQVFLAMFTIFSVFAFMVLSVIGFTVNLIDFWMEIKIAFSIGLIMGGASSSLVLIARKSSIFWDLSKKLECKINDAEDKETLSTLFETEFDELRNKAFGKPHYEELRKLYVIIKTKYKYVK